MSSTTPAQRLALIIEGLRRAVAAQIAGRRLAGPFIILICSRLGRLAGLAARVSAGTAGPRRRAASRQPSKRPRPTYQRLPRRFAWLLPLVPGEAAAYGSQLQHLLADPEMAALIAAAPQAGRILRPLCRMLGVRLPPSLRQPSLRQPSLRTPRPSAPAAGTAGPVLAPRPPPAALSSPRPAAAGPTRLPPRHACGPPVPA